MNENFRDIITAALSGDEGAYEALYTMTKDSAYFIALSITHNEQDALDILQESYIKAFSHLSELNSPELFDKWLNRTVANCSKDFLRIRKPMLFSNMPENINIEELNEENDSDLIPHENIDKQEASRLIMEIINELPENKRLVILMYYYQDMSTKEISETLELPLTTVKYYLLEGRKQIKAELEKLDKEGTRLYAVVPFALFPSFIEQAAENVNAPVFSSVSPKIMNNVNTGVGNQFNASQPQTTTSPKLNGGKNMFLKTTAGKIITAVAAAAVIGGGVTTAVIIANNNNGGSQQPYENTESQIGSSASNSNTQSDTDLSESSQSDVQYSPVSDFEYEINGDEVTITKYTGSDSDIAIPDTIEGKKVTKLLSNSNSNIFAEKGKIKSVKIPNSVKNIGAYTFRSCLHLESVNIPNSVEIIGIGAFSDCWELQSISIPDSVTSIERGAFSDSGLKSIEIPNSVKSIGVGAFSGTKLTSITIHGNDMIIGSNAFSECLHLTDVTMSDDVTSIGDGAFSECPELTSIEIPNGVTSIGTEAFASCEKLESITISDSVSRIGTDAFDGTSWFKNQPDGVVYAGKVAYDHKGPIEENTTIELKPGTKGIAGKAFQYSSHIVAITIPDSVLYIGDEALSDTSIENINIPSSVIGIGKGAFDNTKWYENQPNGLVYAGKFAYKCKGGIPKDTTIELKPDTKGIAGEAFYECKGLKSITIPDSVSYIGSGAFRASNIESINIPNGVTEIETDTFRDCKNLKSITIPDSVLSIGPESFFSCTSLESITIPDSVVNIESWFEDCKSLTIKGKSGSAAEGLAKIIEIPFVAE